MCTLQVQEQGWDHDMEKAERNSRNRRSRNRSRSRSRSRGKSRGRSWSRGRSRGRDRGRDRGHVQKPGRTKHRSEGITGLRGECAG